MKKLIENIIDSFLLSLLVVVGFMAVTQGIYLFLKGFIQYPIPYALCTLFFLYFLHKVKKELKKLI